MLGTPTEDNWPGISRSEELASYKFPPHSGESLVVKAPRLDSDGIGLLSSFLLFEAKKRLPAREALKHPYFSSFPSEIRMLKDSELFLIFVSHHQVVFPLSKQRTNVSETAETPEDNC